MTVALLAPGFIFLLAATALLIVVSVSVPIWNSVYFLQIGLSSSITSGISSILPGTIGDDLLNQKIRAGLWGYCAGTKCTDSQLGYTLPGDVFGDSKAADILGAATSALILHPIAAAFAAFALLFALCGNLVAGLMASVASGIAFFVALVAFIVDLGIFVTAHRRANRTDNIAKVEYGNAIWLTLAAVLLLFLASFTVCCAHHRRRRARHADAAASPPMTERRRPFWRRNRA
jgi:hypothetical protein